MTISALVNQSLHISFAGALDRSACVLSVGDVRIVDPNVNRTSVGRRSVSSVASVATTAEVSVVARGGLVVDGSTFLFDNVTFANGSTPAEFSVAGATFSSGTRWLTTVTSRGVIANSSRLLPDRILSPMVRPRDIRMVCRWDWCVLLA
jgi:hypothetical protein